MRIEKDVIGCLNIKEDKYYGIDTMRAIENFPISKRPLHPELIKSLAIIKKAAAITNNNIGKLSSLKSNAIVKACDEVILGDFHEQIVVDAMQGGAGTSANMNVNEVLANRAIEHLGAKKGDYDKIHPNDDVNMSQSTNDVFPTAVKITAIRLLDALTEKTSELQSALQEKENEFSDTLKVGRTQLQDAVPIMLGQEFAAWASGISRDRWRLYKSKERLRQVNIGGTAVGTGLNADRKYIFSVIETLRELTGQGLARAEFMMDPTQNSDVFVEVSGFLKTSAVNLNKIANDLRILSSGPICGFNEINLPKVQSGSSIMPGKVNPVIPEAINQICFQIMGNDHTITIAASSGQLELNSFIPIIAHNLFEMIDLLVNGVDTFINKCIKGITANKQRCLDLVEKSYVQVTALAHFIGYDKASFVAKKCAQKNKTVKEIILEENILSQEEINKYLNPYKMTVPYL